MYDCENRVCSCAPLLVMYDTRTEVASLLLVTCSHPKPEVLSNWYDQPLRKTGIVCFYLVYGFHFYTLYFPSPHIVVAV